MCSCAPHSAHPETLDARSANELTFRVDDMACGHCAGTIKQAIENALPGTKVNADSASKLVTVRGGGDYPTIRSIVSGVGYKPGTEPEMP